MALILLITNVSNLEKAEAKLYTRSDQMHEIDGEKKLVFLLKKISSMNACINTQSVDITSSFHSKIQRIKSQ